MIGGVKGSIMMEGGGGGEELDQKGSIDVEE